MSNFLEQTNKMILELKDSKIRLVRYDRDEAFGHETVIYRQFYKKLFIEFFYDARDGVAYNVSVARYYPFVPIEKVIFVSINELAKKSGWIKQDDFLSFEDEFKMLKQHYKDMPSPIPKRS